jgi:hypothetical protein
MAQSRKSGEFRDWRPHGVLVIGHSEDGGGWLMVKAGDQVLAQVALPQVQMDQLGYELLLGNKFGNGILPVSLL